MDAQIETVVNSSTSDEVARMTALRERLMQKIDKQVAPSGIFHWSTLNPYGITKLDGSQSSPPISLTEFRDLYHELHAGAQPFAAPMATLAELDARAQAHRSKGLIPIAIAHFEYTTVRRRYVAALSRHAKEGTPFAMPQGAPSPAELKEAVESKLAFFASPLLKQEFVGFVPAPITHFGLHARFALPQDCYLSNVSTPVSSLEIDLDDGKGWQPLPIGGEVTADYTAPGSREIYMRAKAGDQELMASFHLEVSASTAPPPNETWQLKSPLPPIDGTQPTGTAWVFLGKGNSQLTAPVLIAEGFPGGYSLDFLWSMLNQQNVATDILAAGRDVVIVGFSNGTFYMEGNAGVMVDAINTSADHIKRSGKKPSLVVGGASMGGVVARYALTYMEANNMEHYTAKYFSIDSPHNGAYVPCSTQLFTNVFKGESDAVAQAQKLLQSVASRQLLLGWVDADNKVYYSPNALRNQFNDNLRKLGWYPKKPEKYGLADGSGQGYGNGSANGSQALWWSEACAGADLYTQPGQPDGDRFLIAQLACRQTYWTDYYLRDTIPGCEPAPGGTSPTYKVVADALKSGNHKVTLFHPSNCFIPTISALAMDGLSPFNNAQLNQDVSKYFNQDHGGETWLDKYTFANGNQEHVALDANLAGWIFGNLTGKTVFVVNAENQIFSLPDGECYPLDAGARDVAVAGDGTVYALSQEVRPGGYAPFWLNRASKTWQPIPSPAAGTSIGIRPVAGIPYVTDSSGAIFALAKDGHTYPIACPDKARDIAFGGQTLWIVTSIERAGGFAPAYSWRGMSPASWTTVAEPAAAVRIAALPNGAAMLVDSQGQVSSIDSAGHHVAYPGVVAKDIGVASDGTVWVISNIERPGGFAPCWLDWGTKQWRALPAPAAAVKIAAL